MFGVLGGGRMTQQSLTRLSPSSKIGLLQRRSIGLGSRCHNLWWRTIFFFLLPFIYHVYFYSRSHDWRSFFRTWLIGSHTLLSHVTHRSMTHVDSGWLIVTHRCFTLCCFTYICFTFHFMTHTRTPIVLVTYCSCDVHCSCDVYCSSDAIVHFTIKSGLLSSL